MLYEYFHQTSTGFTKYSGVWLTVCLLCVASPLAVYKELSYPVTTSCVTIQKLLYAVN